jgi:hypothetical protein
MGMLLLQIGQGGIQFGSAFLDSLLALSTPGKPPCGFFRESMQAGHRSVARTVLIDMEPNVSAHTSPFSALSLSEERLS